jgi:hypothetical protein
VLELARVLGRCLWMAILLIAVPLPLAACYSGGGGDAGRTQASPPKLLPPAGFSGTAAGFSAVLSWSAPSGSAKIIGYEIRRDGSLLRSVSPDETTLTDFGVRPGKAYAYEIRALDGTSSRNAEKGLATSSGETFSTRPYTAR